MAFVSNLNKFQGFLDNQGGFDESCGELIQTHLEEYPHFTSGKLVYSELPMNCSPQNHTLLIMCLLVLPSPKGSSRVLFNICVIGRSKTQLFLGGTSAESPGQEAVVLPLSMLGVGVVEVQIPKKFLRREAGKLCSWAASGSGSRSPGLSSLLFFSPQ